MCKGVGSMWAHGWATKGEAKGALPKHPHALGEPWEGHQGILEIPPYAPWVAWVGVRWIRHAPSNIRQ